MSNTALTFVNTNEVTMSEVSNAKDALVRGRRLQAGKCPDHGAILVRKADFVENEQPVGRVYGCPECEFQIEARNGSRLMKLLR